MTEKKRNILKTALKLFATEGYASTSTGKIARAAGVSEGLIFRHFKNKEGLLDAILEQGHEAAKAIMAEVVMTSDPKEALTKALEIPFNIGEEQYEMWRLIYALKWQTNRYDDTFQEPFKWRLKEAFSQLGYEDPESEIALIFMFIDGAATSFLLHPPPKPSEILAALKLKYNL